MPDSPSAVAGPGGGKDVGICRPKDTRGGMTVEAVGQVGRAV